MQTLKAALIGPQLLAFAPATFLIAYWYGLDAAVVFVVSVMVVLLGLVRVLGTPRTDSPAKLPVDSVTGLYLRKAAIQHLEEAFHLDQARERRPVALAVEIDDFERRRSQDFWNGLRPLIDRWDDMIVEFNAATGVGT
jgi:hypothetical protein